MTCHIIPGDSKPSQLPQGVPCALRGFASQDSAGLDSHPHPGLYDVKDSSFVLLIYCCTHDLITLRFTVCILSGVWRRQTVIAKESIPGPGMSRTAQSLTHRHIQ